MVKNIRDASWIPGRGRSPEKGMATHSSILTESHGQRSLMGYSPWGCREADMTELARTRVKATKVLMW